MVVRLILFAMQFGFGILFLRQLRQLVNLKIQKKLKEENSSLLLSQDDDSSAKMRQVMHKFKDSLKIFNYKEKCFVYFILVVWVFNLEKAFADTAFTVSLFIVNPYWSHYDKMSE
jgi:hypothetical protein